MSRDRACAEILADPRDREAMAYELAKTGRRMKALKRLGVDEAGLQTLIRGYLRRFPMCRNVDNLLGGA